MAKSLRKEQKMHYGEDGEVCRLLLGVRDKVFHIYLSFKELKNCYIPTHLIPGVVIRAIQYPSTFELFVDQLAIIGHNWTIIKKIKMYGSYMVVGRLYSKSKMQTLTVLVWALIQLNCSLLYLI